MNCTRPLQTTTNAKSFTLRGGKKPPFTTPSEKFQVSPTHSCHFFCGSCPLPIGILSHLKEWLKILVLTSIRMLDKAWVTRKMCQNPWTTTWVGISFFGHFGALHTTKRNGVPKLRWERGYAVEGRLAFQRGQRMEFFFR